MTTRYLGCRIEAKIKDAIEKQVPDRWASVSAFVLEAIAEKIKREGIKV